MTCLRDESLRCQEASLAKLAEIESLERETVEHEHYAAKTPGRRIRVHVCLKKIVIYTTVRPSALSIDIVRCEHSVAASVYR